MKSILKPLLLSVLLCSTGVVAVAQSAGQGPQQRSASGHHGPSDMAKMQEHRARRQAELKAMLQLDAVQQESWDRFIAAMQPTADRATAMGRESRARMHEEMKALTTPQRIDRMTAMKAQRDARMAARHEATKAFYATLTPGQQKVFDDNTMGGRSAKAHRHGGKGHHG